MESAIIDRLYDIYINQDEVLAQEVMMSAYILPESKGGGSVLINHIKDYINANLGNLPNYFSSKEIESEKDKLVLNISNAMVDIAFAMDHYRTEIRQNAQSEIEEEPYDDDYSSEYVEGEDDYLFDYFSVDARHVSKEFLFEDNQDYVEDTWPQELFFMGKDAINLAYEKYKHKIAGLTQENFAEVQRFIDYVKRTGLLSRIFVDNDITRINISSVISALVDADPNIIINFHVEPLVVLPDEEDKKFELFDYFQYMKASCDQIKDIDFTEYRATFISKRGFNVDLDKLVFARNYLEFIRTGIMPSPNGIIYFSVDSYTKFKAEENFLAVYRKGFDNKKFAEQQGNFIFDIDNNILYPDKFEKIKAIKKGNSLTIGCLLSSRIRLGTVDYDDTYYLVHINIEDVANSKSNYELQLNVLPEGSVENRVQLVRFDNWAEEQTHKNIGNKLRTTTHIHIYNHFDLLRGKTNGAYDIAFNLEEESTNFETALKVFLDFVAQDKKLSKSLQNKILKIKATAESRLETSAKENA